MVAKGIYKIVINDLDDPREGVTLHVTTVIDGVDEGTIDAILDPQAISALMPGLFIVLERMEYALELRAQAGVEAAEIPDSPDFIVWGDDSKEEPDDPWEDGPYGGD